MTVRLLKSSLRARNDAFGADLDWASRKKGAGLAARVSIASAPGQLRRSATLDPPSTETSSNRPPVRRRPGGLERGAVHPWSG